MKLLRISSKSIICAAILFLAGTNTAILYVAAPDYTVSKESIHCHFDKMVMQNLKTLQESFSPTSKELLTLTAKKLKNGEQIVQEFVKALKAKVTELESKANKTAQDRELYAFIDILIKIADEVEKHFSKAFTTLDNGLKQKLKAAAFAKKLIEVGDNIMTPDNFKKIDNLLDQLQKISPTKAATEIKEIRADIANILAQYKNKSKTNSEMLTALRARIPK